MRTHEQSSFVYFAFFVAIDLDARSFLHTSKVYGISISGLQLFRRPKVASKKLPNLSLNLDNKFCVFQFR
jgi:hypothetical protein